MRSRTTLRIVALLTALVVALLHNARVASGEKGTQGIGLQGIGRQGIGMQGIGLQGIGRQGIGRQGIGLQGIGRQGIGLQGIGRQGIGRQGIGLQGIGLQGIGLQGIGRQGIGRQGIGRQGIGRQGIGRQGIGRQGIGRQGIGRQGIGLQGLGLQGIGRQGIGRQGIGLQGIGRQGIGRQGIGLQGIGLQGIGLQGIGRQGIGRQGIGLQGTALRGIDRLGVVVADLEVGAIRLAEFGLVDGLSAQGIQSSAELPTQIFSNETIEGVRIQAGPDDTDDGSFLCIPDGDDGCRSAAGTFWVLELSDVPDPEAPNVPDGTDEPDEDASDDSGLLLYIADVKEDTTQNQSSHPDNSDIYLYTVYYRHPATAEWQSLCPEDIYGEPHAMAIPTDPFARDDAARRSVTFACTAGGVAAKCSRIWGYKPWQTVSEELWNGEDFVPTTIELKDFYDTCLVAARADYCQDGSSFTRDGTTVDLFDRLDGVSSLVATAGLGYAPGSPEIMLHEEFQISVDKTVEQIMRSGPEGEAQFSSLSQDQQTLVGLIQASGLQSSRYPDLDPGRSSCLASPFIDRCDPREPYACYRANNMPAASYGAFIAINSPRHCSHPDDRQGEALDPLCNQCVTRVCQIDATCCGDAGASYYPGSLLWDQHCIDLRNDVCRTSPDTEVWPAGLAAEAAGSHPLVTPRGAVGVFEGIVSDGGQLFAEGWACDPDHPEASVSVELALGGELGTGTALEVVVGAADRQLAPGWMELVAIECGGGARHGFRVELPATSVPGDVVFLYGIDLDRPGAPFTLLRGGKKTLPEPTASPPPTTGLLWSGWLEPAQNGSHSFEVLNAGETDKYRVWVNGWLVAADGSYPDPEEPEPEGLESPAPREAITLERGVTVGVRIEHAGDQPDSGLELCWIPPGATECEPIPTNALYSLSEHAGNGLRPTYFVGQGFDGTPLEEPLEEDETYGELDHVWPAPPGPVAPPPGTDLDTYAYSVRWHGRVMPPISGIYTFGAESDGHVQIFVEGEAVTDSPKPPEIDQDTCSHDICDPGAPISKSCQQGNFCAARICQSDPFCCLVAWDARCVERVAPHCAEDCSPAPPQEIFLSAGVKYDIRVDYVHQGGGGKLRLLWSLPGASAESIPEEALFASTSEPALLLGQGLNATWFSDPDFSEEALHQTLASLVYQREAPPDAELAHGILCDDDPAACSEEADLAARPVILSPSPGAVIEGDAVTVTGAGVTSGQVQILVDDVPAGGASPALGGAFTVGLSGIGFGKHTLIARNNVSGEEPFDSDPVSVTFVDPSALEAPRILAPLDGQSVEGTTQPFLAEGTPGAALGVRRSDAPGSMSLGTIGSSGSLTGELALEPGQNDLAFSQSLAGSTSPEVALRVLVRPPELVLNQPGPGASVTSPVPIQGEGADPDLGPVYVADGDGDYFALLTDGSSALLALQVAPDGSFEGDVVLDYGRHLLKVAQRVDGVDGDMEAVEIFVTPPAGLVIDSPVDGTDVEPRLTVHGHGALPRTGLGGTGLRSTVLVKQNGARVGQSEIHDDGTWEVGVSLAPGLQSLTATQLVPSLSGAGAVESGPSAAVTVYVRPPAPVITVPVSGATLASLAFEVRGSALPSATVNVYVGVSLAASTTAASDDGAFVVPLTLGRGTHALHARQSLADRPEGPASAQIVISLGDITPPVLSVVDRDIRAQSESLEGVSVGFADNVSAFDLVDGSRPVSCEPPSGSIFPIGANTVICEAADLSDNVGRTSFVVSVTSPVAPEIVASSLTVEATSPSGAPVDYAVSAWGSVGDCSPPGLGEIRACARWEPANGGLGFTPIAMTADPNAPGTVYAVIAEQSPQIGRLFRSSNGGQDWEERTSVGLGPRGLLAPRGAPDTLYAPTQQGMQKSTDGGQNWNACLAPGQVEDVVGASLNEVRPGRLVLWGGGRTPGLAPFVLVTEDGCEIWTRHDLGSVLATGEYPLYVAEDPTSDPLSPRFYLSTHAAPGGPVGTRIFVKEGAPPWRRLDVPPLGFAGQVPAHAIHVSPVENELGHATVFTSTVISRDGGASWTPFGDGYWVTSFQRDPASPSRVYAAGTGGLQISEDDGVSWSPHVGVALEQIALDAGTPDFGEPPVLYGREYVGGLSRSLDDGESWDRLELTGLSMNDGSIHDVAIDPVDPDTGYVLKAGDGLFKTEDGGKTWRSARGGFDAAPGREVDLTFAARQLAIDPFQRRTVYAAGGQVWKSTNSASLWSRLAAPGVPETRGPQGAFAPDPYAAQALLWAPWGQDRIWQSANGGGIWTAAGEAPDACTPDTNIALNPQQVDFPSPLESDPGGADSGDPWELVDGETIYTGAGEEVPDPFHGILHPIDGSAQVTIDFAGGEARSFDQVTLWHHSDNGVAGHNIPFAAGLEVLTAEGNWEPIAFGRTFDLTYAQPATGFGSYPDTYTFPTVTGSKVRWSFDGTGPNVLGTPKTEDAVGNIATGARHSCARLLSGTVLCWGDNGEGQLGTGSFGGFNNTPVPVAGLNGVTAITAGEEHTCALLLSGQVTCWGNGSDGQLGDPGATGGSASPVLVAGINDATHVAAGQFHTCAILESRRAACWGRGTDGQLGNSGNESADTPVTVAHNSSGFPPLEDVTDLAAGLAHTCAIADNTVYCWGFGGVGSLATGDTQSSPVAVEATVGVLSDETPVELASGEFHTCARLQSGRVACWGYGFDGQLGDGTTGSFTSSAVEVTGLDGVSVIAAGQYHTCAQGVGATGGARVHCWGLGVDGQLGNGDADAAIPSPVVGSLDVTDLAGGEAHSCALTDTGHVLCWGNDSFGQLGTGFDFGMTTAPVPVVGLSTLRDIEQVSSGDGHVCAVRSDGRVFCWGDNEYGRLGRPSSHTFSSAVPLQVWNLEGAVSVAAGGLHTCAVLESGEVRCWGAGQVGQLGHGQTDVRPTPVAVVGLDSSPRLDDVMELAAGSQHTCALLGSGSVACWGDDTEGQIGNSFVSSSTPELLGVEGALAITAGDFHTCALVDGGGVVCWGRGDSGQLGNASFSDSASPVPVLLERPAVEIAAGDDHTCALLDTAEVACWGLGDALQLGNAAPGNSAVPIEVSDLDEAASVGAGDQHSCAVLTSGEVACWGRNSEGQLGLEPGEEHDPSSMPLLIPELSDAIAVAGGGFNNCALRATGEVACWGSGAQGELGQIDPEFPNIPVAVWGPAAESGAVGVAAGGDHSCALRANGDLNCWGRGADQELGNFAIGDVGSPIPVVYSARDVSAGERHTCIVGSFGDVFCSGAFAESGLSGFLPVGVFDAVRVGSGGEHACAVRDGGEVACWGAGGEGRLGNGDTASSMTAVAVVGLVDATAVDGGEEHTCALRDGGEVTCWGSGDVGELGNGGNADSTTPVDVFGLSDITMVAAGGLHTCALHASGVVDCWGAGGSGQLGNGDVTDSNLPSDVNGISDVIAIGAGALHTCAVHATGELSCWGSNSSGQLGIAGGGVSTTPVTVPNLTTVVSVAAGDEHTCALLESGEAFCFGDGMSGQLGDGAYQSSDLPVPVAGFFAAEIPDSGSGGPYNVWIYEFEVRGCDPGAGPVAGAGGEGLAFQILPGSPRRFVYTTDQDTFLSQGSLDDWAPLGTGQSPVLVDRSTTPPTFYVGGAGIGQDPSKLYRSTDPTGGVFSEVGGHAQLTEAAFRRFALDASGNGAMYAIGDGFTFMVSADRGASWYSDPQAPPDLKITNLWLSPVDGAIFASALPERYIAQPSWWDPKQPSPGNLWKRTTEGALPPGARVAQSEIRPTCVATCALTPEHPACAEAALGAGDRSVLAGATFPLGTTPITCSVTDVFGNSDTDTFIVTVEDTTPPEIVVPDQLLTTAPSEGTADVTFEVSAVDAVDGEVDVTCNAEPGTPVALNVGVHTVLCTATDDHDNTASAAFAVVVSEENQAALVPPVLSVPPALVVEATSAAGADVTYEAAAQSGDGAGLATDCSPASGATFPLGTTTVACSATDATGTVADTFRVTVRDTTPPSLEVPDAIEVTATESWGEFVTFDTSATDAVDGSVPITCSPASGSAFAPGRTTVTCRAGDHAGNTASASLEVTVLDNLPPEIELSDVLASATDLTGARVSFEVGASDPEGDTVVVSCTPASDSWFPLGDSEVACTATDDAGNETRGSFLVKVADEAAPLLHLPEPSPIVVEAAGPGGSTVDFDVSASDRVDGALTPVCERQNPVGLPTPVVSGALFPLGLWEVACKATDLAQNQTTGSFAVRVQDTTPPVLSLPGDLTFDAPSPLGVEARFVASASDEVSGTLPVACTPAAGSLLGIGTTQVRCVTRDQAGNDARGSFAITVRFSNTRPVIDVPGDLTAEATGPDGADVTFAVTASDAEDGALVPTCDPPSGSTFPLGTTLVACSVSDGGGLAATADFDVTVEDTTDPVVIVPDGIEVEATGPSGAAVTFTASASDLVSGTLPVTCTPLSGSVFSIGDHTVNCTATDDAGNQGDASFEVSVTDGAAPVFRPVTDPVRAFATSTRGARVSYPRPRAFDAVDGERPVSCSPASGSWFAPNRTTVTCTSADRDGHRSTLRFVVWVTYDAPTGEAFFLSPVRGDGRSLFRIGQTVPVRFRLRGVSADIRDLEAGLFITKISDSLFGTIEDPSDEPVDFSDDSDATFRYHHGRRLYEARWRTRRESRGTYLLRADLGDGVTREVTVSLRR